MLVGQQQLEDSGPTTQIDIGQAYKPSYIHIQRNVIKSDGMPEVEETTMAEQHPTPQQEEARTAEKRLPCRGTRLQEHKRLIRELASIVVREYGLERRYEGSPKWLTQEPKDKIACPRDEKSL
jgi:hypothetical protein